MQGLFSSISKRFSPKEPSASNVELNIGPGVLVLWSWLVSGFIWGHAMVLMCQPMYMLETWSLVQQRRNVGLRKAGDQVTPPSLVGGCMLYKSENRRTN